MECDAPLQQLCPVSPDSRHSSTANADGPSSCTNREAAVTADTPTMAPAAPCDAVLQVTTPQITWHGGENGKNDPVLSADVHPCGVLATSGADADIRVRPAQAAAIGPAEAVEALTFHAGLSGVEAAPGGGQGGEGLPGLPLQPRGPREERQRRALLAQRTVSSSPAVCCRSHVSQRVHRTVLWRVAASWRVRVMAAPSSSTGCPTTGR